MTGLIVVAVFCFAAAAVYRIVTTPRRIKRNVQSVQRFHNTVQQRQADKAAGKPVAPINYIALAGVALAIGGFIVARTTSGIGGLAMVVTGMGVILIGFKMTTATQSSTGQDLSPQQSGSNPSQDGYGPLRNTAPPAPSPSEALRAPNDSPAGLAVSPPQQPLAADPLNARRDGAFREVHGDYHPAAPFVEDIQRGDSNRPATARLGPNLCVGRMAKVVSADKRFTGRIGQVVALSGHDVEMKFQGTFGGSLSFRLKDVIAMTEPTADTPPRTSVVTDGRLIPGATVKVMSGEPRYIGRVGRVVAVDRGMTTLKLNGTFGSLDFRTSDVAAV